MVRGIILKMAVSQVKIEISALSVLRIIALVGALAFLFYIRDIIVLVFLAVVIASAVDPIATFFAKYRIPRVLSVLSVYLFVFAFVTLVLYLVIPNLLSELNNLSKNLPEVSQQIVWGKPLSFLGYNVLIQLQQFLNTLVPDVGVIVTGAVGLTPKLFGGLVSFGAVMVISFYLAVREGEIPKFLKLMTPAGYEAYVVDLWRRTHRKFGKWLQGSLFLSLLVGIFVYIGLTLLGVEYSLSLALLAGAFELIPMVGATLATIPAVLVALTDSWYLALGVLILYIVIQQIENNLMVPLVFRKVIGLNPVVVIVSLLIGVRLAGPLGLIIALPMAAALGEFLGDISSGKFKLK